MNKYKLTALILILVISMGSITGCTNSSSEETTESSADELTKVSIMLDWTPNTNHTGLYVALEKGYFEEAGLDVEIVEASASGAEASVAAGTVDFGISFQDTLVPAFSAETDSQLPITVIATIIQHNTSGIISLKENGIESPSDMAGHSYATWDMPIEQAIINKVVTDDNGDYSQIELISTYVEDISAALQTNIDTVWIYYAWDGVAANLAGLDTNFFYFKDYADELDYYNPVIIGNNEFLDANPDVTKSFMDAVTKGYTYAIDNPEDAAQILVDSNEGLDLDICTASQIWLADQYQAEASSWGIIDQSRWDAFYTWIYENNLCEYQIPEGFGFTNEYLPK